MFILQDGKLHIQEGKKIVGVDVYTDKVLPIKGSETKLGEEFSLLTLFEVMCKFNIELEPYKFPIEVVEKEVTKDDPVVKVKKPSGKSK